jgi:hypothetical protein
VMTSSLLMIPPAGHSASAFNNKCVCM